VRPVITWHRSCTVVLYSVDLLF